MTDPGVVILGIPIPSTSVTFLTVVAVHVMAGLVCVVAGVVAMLAPKRSGPHPTAGTVAYWSLVVVFVSKSATARRLASTAPCGHGPVLYLVADRVLHRQRAALAAVAVSPPPMLIG